MCSLHKAVTQADGSEQHTLFHYGQQGELLGETRLQDTNENSQSQNIVWLQMRPVVALDSSEQNATPHIAWLHSDHLLTARVATDENQNLIWRWHSDAFGVGEAESLAQAGQSELTLNLRFPGQYHDAESGLYYNYFRSYDPSMGRYTQSDPIGLLGGVNTFAYVGGKPLTFMDLLGLCGLEAEGNDLRENAIQRELRLAGDVEGYYTARAAAGDRYAARALMVVRNECVSWETCLMSVANIGLTGTALINMVEIDMRDVQIRLMNAHATAVEIDELGVKGLLNPEQVAEYHHEVFRDLGLPSSTFGGTPLTGWVWEANVWRQIPGFDWCEGCDTE